MTFHHGTSTKREQGGSVAVETADGAVIGIVGTAPIGPVNELTMCLTMKDFARFSNVIDQGYTLPDAFEILRRYRAGKVYVINVLDPVKHRTNMEGEALTVDENTLMAHTLHKGLLNLTVKEDGSLLQVNEDYEANLLTGEIRFKALKENITVDYTFADPSKVTNEDIQGGVDVRTNKRSGFAALQDGFNLTGTDAKVLICPEFDKDAVIAAELEITATNLGAFAYVQLPKGTSLSKAIAGRGPKGTINAQASSERVRHFYPYALNGERLESLATHAAGLRMQVDCKQGYWWSTSNHSLLGVTGVEIPLTSRIDDVQSETNLLNAVGITTIFNSFGTGFRLWGNRSSNYPTVTHIVNFEVATRTGDLIDESIRRASLQFSDRPIDDAVIDSILETVDTYLRALPSIVGYSISLDYDYDLVDEFSKGHIPFVYDYTPKLPAELIKYRSVITRKYLANLIKK